jgi:predicted enzyme related to lactoylglutathione lyase
VHILQSRLLLRPADLDRSITFYEGQLGLARYREWGESPHRGVVYFLGGGYLELSEGAGADAPRGVRLWLQVADATAAHAELLAAGVRIVAPPARKPWGLIELEIDDPDGLRLVVIETPIDHPLRRRD